MQNKNTDRVKPVNVRHDKKDGYFIVLSDGSELSWDTYVSMGQDHDNPKLSKLSMELEHGNDRQHQY